MSGPRLVPPHNWRYIGFRLEADCPECGEGTFALYALDVLLGMVDLHCAACGFRERVELICWLGAMPPAKPPPLGVVG